MMKRIKSSFYPVLV